MNSTSVIKDNLNQIFAIVEKNLKLVTRFKLPIIMGYVFTFLALYLPLIIMGQIFSFSEDFGRWNLQNYYAFIFIVYQINLVIGIMNQFPTQLSLEKTFITLQAIIIAPFNRINLLFGTFFTYLILVAIPFSYFFILTLIILPASIITILFLLLTYFLISLIFSGVGIFLGVLRISKPSLPPIIAVIINLLFIFSSISYPFEFFPSDFQQIIIYNPLYYIIDFVRILWLDNNIFITITSCPFHLFLLVGAAVVFPILGLWSFNTIFKKYGIVGY